MQIITNNIGNINLKYPLEKIGNPKDCLFIDIETTGFTARSSNLYLIGCAYIKDGIWMETQFFADNYSEEKEVITSFFDFAADYKYLIHFNGNNFDIPYILDKCSEHDLKYNFDSFIGLDIYKRIAPYKAFLKLENCKQKTIEKFLKINREDLYSGGDLIGVYHSYVEKKDEESRRLLLLHNFDDVKGMLEILPILAYTDLFQNKLRVTKVSANSFTDVNGVERCELLMTFDTPSTLLIPVSALAENCYFAGAANQAMIRVPLIEDELKYFYANYKEYYYLPDEDTALHKSVAEFVDKSRREPCKAANCYTKRRARFLPEWDVVVAPFFKREYKDNVMYFELTDERKTDRALFSAYAEHILNHIASCKL